jgi:diaminohydroxyphosphoribosylaminopyrimidine deaminase/5-amino-6-(5-phosphoribosylamino)uracil reductase
VLVVQGNQALDKALKYEQMDQHRGRPELDDCWRLLLAAAKLARDPAQMPNTDAAFMLTAEGQPRLTDSREQAWLHWQPDMGWSCGAHLRGPAREFVEFYLPLCQPLTSGCRVVAHLGQSLDGYIATHNGDAHHVTGADNIRHLHRMRALGDAVVVGAGTVASDDPKLTTRLVAGPHAVRVVLDPQARLGAGYRVFTDGVAPTLLCRQAGIGGAAPGQARLLEVAVNGAGFNLVSLLGGLARCGLRRLFIEGGGVTVSRFLSQGLLDRLQIAVAPVIIGGGRTGVSLPPSDAMTQALRPSARIYRMGADMLYDFDLANGRQATPPPAGLRRLI